jgi:hypothetical protein
MKLHRPLLAVALASFGSSVLLVQAQDNEAQRKALEALRQAQSGTPAVSRPAVVPETDTPAQRQALEAIRAQQAGKANVTPSSPSAAVSAENPAQRAALEAIRQKQASPVSTPVAVSDTEAQRKARAALNERWKVEDASKPAVAGSPSKAPAAAAVAQVAPPKVPTTKEEKLADLTRRYKSDEIAPREYHQMRAKILAEP